MSAGMLKRETGVFYTHSTECVAADVERVHIYRWGDARPRSSIKLAAAPRLVALTDRYLYWVPESGATLEAHPRRANEPRLKLSIPLKDATRLIAPNPKTEQLWVCYADGRIELLSPPNDRPRALFKVSGAVSAHAVFGDEVLVCDSQGTVYRVRNGAPTAQWAVGRWGAAQIDVDPSAQRVISVGAEGIIRIWNLATRQQEQATLGHRRGVLAGVFVSPKQAITLGDDQQTLLWNTERFQQPQTRAITPLARWIALQRSTNNQVYLLTEQTVYQWRDNDWRQVAQWNAESSSQKEERK